MLDFYKYTVSNTNNQVQIDLLGPSNLVFLTLQEGSRRKSEKSAFSDHVSTVPFQKKIKIPTPIPPNSTKLPIFFFFFFF